MEIEKQMHLISKNQLKLTIMKTTKCSIRKNQKSNLKIRLFVIAGIMLLSSISLFSQNKEVEIKSKIDDVTVYLNSAQVFRSGSFSLSPGTYELIFSGVSPQINDKSIQANGAGSFTILDVKHRIKYPEAVLPEENVIPPKIIKDIKILQDSIAKIQFDIDDYNSQGDVLRLEKQLIEKNKMLTGNCDTIPEIKDGLNYLRTQLLDINKKLIEISKNVYRINKIKERMNQRLSELQSYNTKVNPVKVENPVDQVVVTISTNAQTNGKVEISYMVNSAGWTSTYDIRAESSDKPLKLVQKANIFQNTGEDWNNVKLKLSTINPNTNNYIPNLSIQYLSYYVNRGYNTTLDYSKKDREYAAKSSAAGAAMQDEYMPALSSADFMQSVETMTNVEYKIPLSYSIPSDGQYHLVAIQNINLKTEYSYYVVPKLDKQAFLVAKITDFENYELLPGEANIFFNGSYVGSTSLNTSELSDTIELALGRDRSILVERKKLKEEKRNVLIENNSIKTLTYEISLKNSKSSSVSLIVTDQIPISNDKSIIVKPLITKGANFTETTGILTWKVKLNTNESKTLKFSYSIESDKDKPLANAN